jgi:hypothetical protein
MYDVDIIETTSNDDCLNVFTPLYKLGSAWASVALVKRSMAPTTLGGA